MKKANYLMWYLWRWTRIVTEHIILNNFPNIKPMSPIKYLYCLIFVQSFEKELCPFQLCF